MALNLFGKIRFRFNGGRGLGGDQITVDNSLNGEEDLGISDAFKLEQRESFSSRYHTGGFRYDRTFFAEDYFNGDIHEIVGVETWNSVTQVITATGIIGREQSNGGPYQIPGLNDGETVRDFTRHGDFAFVATTTHLRVYRINDVAGSATLAQTYTVDGLKAVGAPNDDNNPLYILMRVDSGTILLRRYDVHTGDGSLTQQYESNITVAQLNTALGVREQSISNVDQIRAISTLGGQIWIYVQRSADIKIINIDDDEANTQFTVNVDFDHESGRLQDITGATRNANLEIVSSRFVVNLFTHAGDDSHGNYRGDTMTGSLYDSNDPLNVRWPWAGVNPTQAELNDILQAANLGLPVFYQGKVWFIDSHHQSMHDAVIAFAEPTSADFGAGLTWRGSFTYVADTTVPVPQDDDIAYDITLGIIARRMGGLWHVYTTDRYLGPGPARSESQARVRVASSTATNKIGLLVSWDGHGLRRVSAYTPPVTQSTVYDLHPVEGDNAGARTFLFAGNTGDLPDASDRRNGDLVLVSADASTPTGATFRDAADNVLTALQRGQLFRYQLSTTDYRITLDGRYPWLSINPSATQLQEILIVANVGRPVFIDGHSFSVQHVHHDAIDAVVTFEDPPTTVFGAIYHFRGSVHGNSEYPASPNHNDVVYDINFRQLEIYQNNHWRAWTNRLLWATQRVCRTR